MFSKADLQAAEQLRRALQLFAATLPEAQAREVATVYPRFEVGRAYEKGQYITCGTDENGDPCLYRVEQNHTSQEDWPPADNPALYTCISMTPSGYPIWSQPTGAQDAYNIGDIVSYNGTLYQSKINGNVWAPDTYPDGWDVLSDAGTERED